MDSCLLMTLCFFGLFVPITGLQCYTCKGEKGPCADGTTDQLVLTTCPEPASGEQSSCLKKITRTVVKWAGTNTTVTERNCTTEPQDGSGACTKYTGPQYNWRIYCYCAEDGCNGQLPVTPERTVCYVGLFVLLLFLK